MSASGSHSTILDIPNKVLRKIIKHLNASERITLGVSCQRFNSLVFEDEGLLRDLDFSQEAYLTSEKDIQQYFSNERTYECLRRLNVRNVCCMKPGYVLEYSLGKAINLVDINIHGLEFQDICQLGAFLKPLLHLQKLSFDWPNTKGTKTAFCRKLLHKPFSRLVYLSVVTFHLNGNMRVFISCLGECQRLTELHMVVNGNSHQKYADSYWNENPNELTNIKIVEYCGPHSETIKKRFLIMLPISWTWMDFQLDVDEERSTGFYLEQHDLDKVFPESLDICIELEESGFLDRLPKLVRENCDNYYIINSINWCDAHLVASAFPNLTELVLAGSTRSLESPIKNWHFRRRLRDKTSTDLKKHDKSLNMDSSFKMLVQNTPNLRHFTMEGRGSCYSSSDQDALYLISNWKNLRTLRLLKPNKEDANFLIYIGKECKHLEKLELMNVGYYSSSDSKKVSEMLKYCKKLTDISIEDWQVNACEVFTSLANKAKLKRVCVKTLCHTLNSMDDLISSIQELFDQSPNLTKFQCELDRGFHPEFEKLALVIERLQSELSRPKLQIHVVCNKNEIGAILEDAPRPHPFPHLKWMEN